MFNEHQPSDAGPGGRPRRPNNNNNNFRSYNHRNSRNTWKVRDNNMEQQQQQQQQIESPSTSTTASQQQQHAVQLNPYAPNLQPTISSGRNSPHFHSSDRQQQHQQHAHGRFNRNPRRRDNNNRLSRRPNTFNQDRSNANGLISNNAEPELLQHHDKENQPSPSTVADYEQPVPQSSRGRRITLRYNHNTRQNDFPSEANDTPVSNGRRLTIDRNSKTDQETAGNGQKADATKSMGQCNIAENQFQANTFECLICCDNILRHQSIWSCSNCFNIFHLKCAIEWCNKSIKSRNDALEQAQYPSLGLQANNPGQLSSQTTRASANVDQRRQTSVEWPCPTCREILHNRPGKYKCFCGKVTNPEINRHLTPHSCGQVCGRKRPNQACPHNCNSLCHPGRCIPCNLMSQRSCYCGKLMRQIKCSDPDESCQDVCDKLLLCGKHNCKKRCHDGSCETCEQILTIDCNCGKEQIEKKCLDIYSIKRKNQTYSYSCEEICGRLLDCGNHYCMEKCHPSGTCKSCNLLSLNIKTCPCGSTHIDTGVLEKRKSCLDPVPTCQSKCDKLLICGPEKSRHKCKKKCHSGTCPPCKLKMSAQCECKLSTRNIDCSLMFEKIEDKDGVLFKQRKYTFNCETRCNSLKNCGRHRCNNKCCMFARDSSLHKCDQTCNRKLQCGQHNCTEPCHPGQCGDCPNIGWQELSCHCGHSIMYPPIPCGARPPACSRPCRRPHQCGHQVKHECHDDSEKCPPCTVFVKKDCFCGAESKDSVYCYQVGYSCGRTCKKKLACKQHDCKRVCHDNGCETPTKKRVILCNQTCPVARYQCKHPCGLLCHGNTPCPPSDCKKIIEISCKCGNRKEKIECVKVMREVDSRNKLAMLSTNRSNQESIMIDLSASVARPRDQDLGGSPDANNLQSLECDENCLILERNKALAEALDIAETNVKPMNVLGQDPYRLLREATTQDYKLVSNTFNSLAKFVKAAKESEKRFTFIQFPAPDKLKREIIHEIAQHFHCTSETKGDEPFKVVVVRAYKNKSCVPDFTIEQLLPVSD